MTLLHRLSRSSLSASCTASKAQCNARITSSSSGRSYGSFVQSPSSQLPTVSHCKYDSNLTTVKQSPFLQTVESVQTVHRSFSSLLPYSHPNKRIPLTPFHLHQRFFSSDRDRRDSQDDTQPADSNSAASTSDPSQPSEVSETSENSAERGSFWQKVVGVGAAGYTAVKVLPGLKFAVPILKFTKLGPVLSMILSSLAYTSIFGWQYGCGMVALIFIHELGHGLMMRHLNVPVGPMTFIPFMGAVIAMKDLPRNAADESAIALAGPVLGSIAALVPFALGVTSGSQIFFALAHWGFMINLFNLLPIGSLDGGRVAGALSPWFLASGVVANAALLYVSFHPILVLTMLSACYTTFNRFFREEEMPEGYYNLEGWKKFVIAGGYFGLIGLLLAAMRVNDAFRKSPKQLKREIEHGEDAWDTDEDDEWY